MMTLTGADMKVCTTEGRPFAFAQGDIFHKSQGDGPPPVSLREVLPQKDDEAISAMSYQLSTMSYPSAEGRQPPGNASNPLSLRWERAGVRVRLLPPVIIQNKKPAAS